ncbi:MAG TPA: TonB-dependent receptor [Granulicella sp.]|jgi:vitamin B12 transporter|nr:TonB-dependent receptor [Granulicella sp.]
MATPLRFSAQRAQVQAETARSQASPRRTLGAAAGRVAGLLAVLWFGATGAHAVVVRGKVTDPLGAAVVNARVALVQGTTRIAAARSGIDGSFEVRSAVAGRFRLLATAPTFATTIGDEFYGGVVDVVARSLVMEVASITEQVTVTATGIPTPIQQASAPVSLIGAFDLSTRVGVIDEMRQAPGLELVQQGQAGGVGSLFVRGGNSTANKVLIDGITAEDIGGTFDLGTVGTTGLESIETYRGPDSVLYGSDAGAAVVSFTTPQGGSSHPLFTYSGDAGNFHSYRNEATLSGAHKKVDYYAGFGRFDTSNALPLDRYHSATSAANIGYSFSGNAQARFTLRNAVSSTGLPGAHDFYGISNDGKQADQDLYSGLTLEDRLLDDRWHNLVRYGITRKREQERQYAYVGTPINVNGFTEYFGNVVTIRGANGYEATGQAAFFSPNSDSDSNRDELYFQSDYAITHHLTGLLGFRYENERGSFVEPDYGEDEKIQRTNFEYTLQFQGDVKNRLFYSAGGAIEKNHLYGVAGTPRLGLAYVPVRVTTNRWFRGTKLRANVATGVQEPSLALEFSSLYSELLQAGDTAAIASYNVTKPTAERSRSYDVGVDQNIRGERLVFKAGYFHNVFDHQLEGVDYIGLEQYFGLPASVANQIYEAYLNSLAFRAQGFEMETDWQAMKHLLVRGGYTYLDSVVVQSFATDAVNANSGMPTMNPNLPGIAIGAVSPLVGARPFRRAPHTGFFAAEYVDRRLAFGMKGALSSRSDDSTFLGGLDTTGGNTLLLPNRDLDFGYAKLDANLSLVVSHHITTFTEMDNLLGQQHIGPIGYPALPFTIRAGLKYRFGGD